MEGSESEAIFESLNLNPQVFLNEVLQSVDDLVDGAFDFFHQQASVLLNINDTDRSADLKQGVDYIHHRVQTTLNKKLDCWEKYCLHCCFVVPDGFSLPDKAEPTNDFAMVVDVLNVQQSDSELDILRNRVSKVEKESAELNRELQALEKQYNMSSHNATAVSEALELYDQNAHDLFGEMMKKAAEIRAKMEKVRVKQMKENEHGRRERISRSNGDISKLTFAGRCDLNLEELQDFLDEIKKA